MKKVLIIDTSVLCVWLEIPGMETCGSGSLYWDKEKVDQKLETEIQHNTVLVLPLATVLETGNHITQARSKPYELAQKLAEIMRKAADETTPWAAFAEQAELWEAEGLKNLADEWQQVVPQKTSLGDATMKMLAEHYDRKGYQVEIMTGDEGLKSYEPIPPVPRPKRRSSR
ncbi:hypothetical protein [Coleofasciculus sp. F4-SAH-05]|jgi:hypothetical protein|uniref:hypothetical protein n=1 Tax=Coleofasciculus sp. F4-SAH-05 TaxID=3069525 RepID=UPI0032FE1155